MKLIKEKILIEFHFSIYDINGMGTTCLTKCILVFTTRNKIVLQTHQQQKG